MNFCNTRTVWLRVDAYKVKNAIGYNIIILPLCHAEMLHFGNAFFYNFIVFCAICFI
ncbi:hypothetical protein D3C84_1034440 [compost metagenome]